MKFYIAGIYLHHAKGAHILDLAKKIVHTFGQIQRDADYYIGKDANIIVVLYENALGEESAVRKILKDKCLKEFMEALKHYPRIILVPGSISYFTELTENKKIKLEQAYSGQKLKYEGVKEEAEQFSNIINHKETYCLKNKAWLFFSSGDQIVEHKHNKIKPYNERNKMPKGIEKKTAFLRGTKTKSVLVNIGNDETCRMGLLVCLDHTLKPEDNYQKDILHECYADIVILVSNTIFIRQKNLTSPMTIHMDKKRQLNVYIDRTHPQYTSKFENYCPANYWLNANESSPILKGCHADILRWAVTCQNHEIMQKALYYTRAVNQKKDDELALIHIAFSNQDITGIKMLVDAGANLKDKNIHGETLMHVAVKNENIECINYLLQHNPDLDETDANSMVTFRQIRKNLIFCLIIIPIF